MPANVEIKARARDVAQLRRRAEELSGSPGCIIAQSDTFFPVPRGRLKLRDLQDGHGQLVFYDRPDSKGPKLSCYAISPTDDPAGLTAVLSQALGVQGTVKKERRLYLVGQTRIHVDRVEGLGDFLELEVVLEEPQTARHGEEVARRLMRELGVREEDLLTGAYLDLLLAGREAPAAEGNGQQSAN
ncbi:Adenylate cyclase CyaB [Varanus komodoensis]|uniref:CYTH domain-containing protein n=1 Tax=Varanus komodoensis TaxID=61221 RepID=A0A8D2LV11_VARKO|nr:Adenylate cyclase CyaB [Varanus komodoensis]